MNDCIFCKITKEEIPSGKIYEDNDFFVFLDIDPVTKGHTLIVPKIHIRWLAEAEDTMINKIFILAKKLMNHNQKVLSCDYIQLVVTGEQVPHLHIHLIPAFFKKETAHWNKVKYESQEEMQEYINKMKL